jgi:hypothetical protein
MLTSKGACGIACGTCGTWSYTIWEVVCIVERRGVEMITNTDTNTNTTTWQPMSTAPHTGKGDPNILLVSSDGDIQVCYYDPYYAEGGNGYALDILPWVIDASGELFDQYYDEPIGWMPLPTFTPEDLARLKDMTEGEGLGLS